MSSAVASVANEPTPAEGSASPLPTPEPVPTPASVPAEGVIEGATEEGQEGAPELPSEGQTHSQRDNNNQPVMEGDSESNDSESSFVNDGEWVEGDITLLSADGVRFRVPGHLLAWASPVFADMLSLPTRDNQKEVHLTNGTFETAETIRLFLEVVSPTLVDVEELLLSSWKTLSKDLHRLVLLLDKYNSEVGVRMLRLYGSEVFLRQTPTDLPCDGLLVFASMTNDVGLCIQVIMKYAGNTWKKLDPDDPLSALKSSSFLSIAQAPFHFASSLPFAYQWALGRAAALFNPVNENEKYCDKFVEIVTKILQEEEDNPFPPIIAKPHMAGYKAPAKKAEGSGPAQATP